MHKIHIYSINAVTRVIKISRKLDSIPRNSTDDFFSKNFDLENAEAKFCKSGNGQLPEITFNPIKKLGFFPTSLRFFIDLGIIVLAVFEIWFVLVLLLLLDFAENVGFGIRVGHASVPSGPIVSTVTRVGLGGRRHV